MRFLCKQDLIIETVINVSTVCRPCVLVDTVFIDCITLMVAGTYERPSSLASFVRLMVRIEIFHITVN